MSYGIKYFEDEMGKDDECSEWNFLKIKSQDKKLLKKLFKE